MREESYEEEVSAAEGRRALFLTASFKQSSLAPFLLPEWGSTTARLRVEVPDGLVWFWIGNHTDYERLLSQ